MKKAVLFWALWVFFFNFSWAIAVESQGTGYLEEGIEQYQKENYEESIPLFVKARKQDPHSSKAAFFLGMAYKQTLHFEDAVVHFQDAVTLAPPIQEALVELIDTLVQVGRLDEALKWIEVAEKDEVAPADVAFLKGLLYQKIGKEKLSIESFEKAKGIDPEMAQAADMQIAMTLMRQNKGEEAKKRFEAAIVHDPDSDLASFARHYQSIIESRVEVKPLRLAVSVFGQYDSNLVLKPNDFQFAEDITDEETTVLATRLRVNYLPRFEGPWLFNAQYTYRGNFNHHHSTTHNLISNDFYVAPGYNFGKFYAFLVGMYKHSLVRDPSFKAYSDTLRAGPMFRKVLGRSHVFEFFPNYTVKKYFKSLPSEAEDRDSEAWGGSLSWIWLFGKDSFFNLRYEFSDEDTDGENWENTGHRFSANATWPIRERVKLQLGADIFLQDYENRHTVFGKRRDDEIYQGYVGISWEILKNTLLILSYTRTQAESNLAVYDYERDLYSLGVEYRY